MSLRAVCCLAQAPHLSPHNPSIQALVHSPFNQYSLLPTATLITVMLACGGPTLGHCATGRGLLASILPSNQSTPRCLERRAHATSTCTSAHQWCASSLGTAPCASMTQPLAPSGYSGASPSPLPFLACLGTAPCASTAQPAWTTGRPSSTTSTCSTQGR